MDEYNLDRSPRHTVTDDLRKQVISLFERGLSRVDIQREADLSQPTIRKILTEAGYPPETKNQTEITAEMRQQIVERYDKIRNAKKVAAEFGIARRTVQNIIFDAAEGLTGRGRAVSAELFIKTWQQNTKVADVAQQLNMNIASVHSRAMQYRQKGVPLKPYYRSAQYNWEELAEFAELFSDDSEPKQT